MLKKDLFWSSPYLKHQVLVKCKNSASQRMHSLEILKSWYFPLYSPWIKKYSKSYFYVYMSKGKRVLRFSVNHKHQKQWCLMKGMCQSFKLLMRNSTSLNCLTCRRIIPKSLLALFTRVWISTGSFTFLFSLKASLILLIA